ncbi:MAG: glycosyltransferase family 4 protein [Bacteroidia bacterium]
MKIGFDAKRAFNNSTGLGNYSRLVILSLLQNFPEHQYYLFTPTIDEKYKNFFIEYNNVEIIEPENYLHKKFHAAWRSYSIGDIVNDLKLNIFHGLSNEIPNGINSKITKTVVTIHDLIFLRYPDYYNTIDAYIYKKKFKRACQNADLILAASQQTKTDIETYFEIKEDKTKVLYQDCDDAFAKQYSAIEKQKITSKYNLPKQFILSVGTIEKRKNQLTILKALAKLPSDWNLVLIGKKTDYSKELIDFATKNNLINRLQIFENINFDDLPIIYQCSQVFVYISEFEGFGIPILEAMKSEIPVITSNCSSLPEVIGSNGKCISPFDFEAIVSFINIDLQNSEAINNRVNEAKKRTFLFDKNSMAKTLIDFYIKSTV